MFGIIAKVFTWIFIGSSVAKETTDNIVDTKENIKEIKKVND